jgi:rod shape-determining protein MreC
MDTFLGRFKNPLVLLAVVLLQTVWLATQVQHPLRPGLGFSNGEDSHKITLLRSWAMTFAGPVERVTHGAGLGVRRAWTNYVDLRGARQQNVALKDEVARLRLEQAAFAQDAAEGRRLQALLEFKQHYVTSTVAAQVIGTSGSDRSHVLWIDKGSADGLRPEQAVITPDGVVGKLRDVMPHSAQLLLINDPNSGAGVILASTRMRAIVRGTAAGEVVINNLTADERIKAGEAVMTSGGDQVFPRGLPVGTIAYVEPDVKHQPYTLIHLKPAANLRQLEEVLVITGTDATLPSSAQADAAQAEAVAAENQRAADLVAARLPSLHDGAQGESGAAAATGAESDKAAAAAGETSGPVPGVPNSGMPKVKAPVHADRYSPGSAPPAEDLTPGAPKQ